MVVVPELWSRSRIKKTNKINKTLRLKNLTSGLFWFGILLQHFSAFRHCLFNISYDCVSSPTGRVPGGRRCECRSCWRGSSPCPPAGTSCWCPSCRWRWPSPSIQTSSCLLRVSITSLSPHLRPRCYRQTWRRRQPPLGTCSGCTSRSCWSPPARRTEPSRRPPSLCPWRSSGRSERSCPAGSGGSYRRRRLSSPEIWDSPAHTLRKPETP